MASRSSQGPPGVEPALRGKGEAIVGESPALVRSLEVARKAAADGHCTVLLSGETGTGKEMVARARTARRGVLPLSPQGHVHGPCEPYERSRPRAKSS